MWVSPTYAATVGEVRQPDRPVTATARTNPETSTRGTRRFSTLARLPHPRCDARPQAPGARHRRVAARVPPTRDSSARPGCHDRCMSSPDRSARLRGAVRRGAAGGRRRRITLVDLTDDAALPRAETSADARRARAGPARHPGRPPAAGAAAAALRAALGDELGLAPDRVPLATTPLGRPCRRRARGPGRQLLRQRRRSGSSPSVGAASGSTSRRWPPGRPASSTRAGSPPEERRALTGCPRRPRGRGHPLLDAEGSGAQGAAAPACAATSAATVTVVGRTDGEVAGWQVHDVPVPHGWVASLAVAPQEKEIPS